MFTDQCISITNLRNQTKKCLEGLEQEPKYIFINNKPVAVIIDIVVYEKNFAKPQLIELKKSEVDETTKKKAAIAKKTKKSDLMDI